MLKWIRRQMQQEQGFTLIELIVVVAIIAILAFTITPRVLDALNNSKLSGARSVANEIHSALERYYANKGTTAKETYPWSATASDLDSFDELRVALGSDVGLSNTTANVFDTTTPFSYEFEVISNTATGVFAASVTDRADWYCIKFVAKDRSSTKFLVTPRGVYEGKSTCPITAIAEPAS